MGIFNRLFKVGQAEAHNIVDKLEDPIKMTEQGIRDLKNDLDESLKSYAEVKSMAIRANKEATEARNQAKNYEQKAMKLLEKAESGGMDSTEADQLAGEALVKKQEAEQNAKVSEENAKQINGNLEQLDAKIKKLRSNISHYENELKTLKARSKVSQATTNLNKQMARIDSGGTISMLEKMKDKVNQQEALSEAYSEVADSNKSLDDKLDDALGQESPSAGSDALAELKAKMKKNKEGGEE